VAACATRVADTLAASAGRNHRMTVAFNA
jgi:hypothetical protein